MRHTEKELKARAFAIRRHIVQTIVRHGEGHAASSMSCGDIMAVLFFEVLLPEDKFFLSAGHKCLALYGALAERGDIDAAVLETYNALHSTVPGHPDMIKLPGVDFSSGSLGHGLPVGCGFALSAKLRGTKERAFVLMGDGEQAEGSVWEAASFAAHHKLDNLTAIIDRNRLQINGTTDEVLSSERLEDRYEAFGWSVSTADGHDLVALCRMTESLPHTKGKPTLIVADTIKGRGLSFMEGKLPYHHWHPGADEAQRALDELDAIEKEGF